MTLCGKIHLVNRTNRDDDEYFYRSSGLGVEQQEGVAVECVIYIECLLEVLYLKSLFEIVV